MGWEIGYDDNWNRDIGYGVPAICDHPGCEERIDRGLSYVCGNDIKGGDRGCGLYFCRNHRFWPGCLCERCVNHEEPFEPKPDVAEWTHHKLTDPSWAEWRKENGIEEPRRNEAEVYGKYRIEKSDGTSVDPNAEYFVLRIDTDPHARKALLAYAKSVGGLMRTELEMWAQRHMTVLEQRQEAEGK